MSFPSTSGAPESVRPAVGDRLTLDIADVAHGGHMVARSNGFVVFVRYALPGERVEAVVTEVRAGFARAEAVSIQRAHRDRVEARCPQFGPGGCGGCDFQHAAGSLQRELKLAVLREALRKQGRLPVERILELTGEGIVDLGTEWAWRSRMRFEVMRDASGTAVPAMHGFRSDDLVDARPCVICREDIRDGAIGAASVSEPGSTVFVAHGRQGVRSLVRASRRGRHRERRGRSEAPIETVEKSVNIDDRELTFEVPVDSFWQSHSELTGALIETVLDFGNPQPGESWWDLYSGAGPLAAAVGVRVGEHGTVDAVEGNSDAVDVAQRALGSLPHIRFSSEDVRTWVARSARPAPHGVVLDPPRSGAGRGVLAGVAAHTPRILVYVACDPVALARDTQLLAECGYVLSRLRAWDAYPQTHHLEAVASFEPADQIS